jgi:hypothetical protein
VEFYDAAKGNAYSAEQNESLEALRKQEEAMRREEATARSASKPAVTSDPIEAMATREIQNFTAK